MTIKTTDFENTKVELFENTQENPKEPNMLNVHNKEKSH